MRDGIDGPPLARRPETEKSGIVNLQDYKHALRSALKQEGLLEKDPWVNEASKIDIYAKHAGVTRFLLFCAADNTIPDEGGRGLIKRGRRETGPLLTVEQWRNEALFTIEHIAPQSQTSEWDRRIYDNDPWYNTLGNLTLLPPNENNVIGNRSWEIKKAWYQLLSSKSDEQFEVSKSALEDKLGSAEINVSAATREVMQNSGYLRLCESIAQCQDWTLEIIKARSIRLAQLVWDRLIPWLN